MFTLFPNFPPEIRHQIWLHALLQLNSTGICVWKKGCWHPKYLTSSDPDYCENDPDNIRLEFREDFLTTPLEIPLVLVNREARSIALAWARQNDVEIQFHKGRLFFKRKMNSNSDALYFPLDKMEEFDLESAYRGFEPDLLDRHLGIGTYVTKFAISETFYTTDEMVPEAWEWFSRVDKIHVIVGKQPDEHSQWEIDGARGRSLFWTKESGEFVLADGEDICDQSLYQHIIEDKKNLKAQLESWHGYKTDFEFEIRICSAVRR
ncbi:hypothetical protein F53441_13841 [Fusarium austroafricanum]|uniref:2EXR domain-containing protein n=1 Tax=Fusarium austroafricanum TaxID=2364996 RepID=A0A8H4JKF4_9HYPO|nr:hypothetical protein F53441_13841 [Fusarium austroafricanum]